MSRVCKHTYYLNLALNVAMRSTCNRRKYGAVIVNNDEVVSTGYNGAPRGVKNCNDLDQCYRIQNGIPSGSQYEKCRSVHAEMNAIISASRQSMVGGILYLHGFDEHNDPLELANCCDICTRLIINSGIEYIVTPNGDSYDTIDVEALILTM